MSGRIRRLVELALGLVSLGLIFGPGYGAHASRAMGRWVFNDDARIGIFPFYRYVEPAAWQGDFLGDYALAITPLGPRLLYTLAGYVSDPFLWSKIVPYPCLILTAAGAAAAAWRFGRGPAAWLAAAIVLSADLYMERMGGGLPRAFAFPIVAWGLAALVHGRMRAALALVVVGALLYPTAGVLLGAAAAVTLLALPPTDAGFAARWPRRRRLAALALAAGLSAAALTPTLLATRAYGPRITPDMLEAYPEAGPKGTHSSEDRPPYDGFAHLLVKESRRALTPGGAPWWDVLREQASAHFGLLVDGVLLVAAVGLVRLRRRRAARRLAAALAGAFVAHLVARVLAPYLYAPSRFCTYFVPVWIAVALPAGLYGLLNGARPVRWLQARLPRAARPLGTRRHGVALQASLLALGIALMLAIGGRGHEARGVGFSINPPHDALYQAIADLPPTARVAGWPDDPMSNVPLMSRRQAFMTGEMHIALHEGYVKAVRPRVRALIAAYFATDVAPLLELRDTWGVSHVFMDRRHFKAKKPSYMPPFDADVKAALKGRRGRPFELMRQLDHATVHSAGSYVLVDLGRLEVDVPGPRSAK